MSLLQKKMAILADTGTPAVNLDTTIAIQSFLAAVKLEILGTGDLIRTLLSADVSVDNNWVTNSKKGGNFGALFETQLTASTGTNPTGAALGVFLTINSSVQWDWTETDEFTGTLVVREIADTGNTDSAAISVTDNP